MTETLSTVPPESHPLVNEDWSESTFYAGRAAELTPQEVELNNGRAELDKGFDLARFLEDDGYATVVNTALIEDALRASRQPNVYTELHLVGNRFIVMPETVPQQKHYAQVGQDHSMFDAVHDLTPDQTPAYRAHAIAANLGLTTDTVRAKGYTVKDDEGHAVFTAQHLREFNGTFDWAKTLPDVAAHSSYLKVLTKVEDGSPIETFTGPKKNIHANIYPKILRHLESSGSMNVNSGFISGLSPDSKLNEPITLAGHELVRNYDFMLDGYEAKTRRHQDVYEAAGFERPHYFKVVVDGYEQSIACDYTENITEGKVNVLVMYKDGDEQSEQFQVVRQLMATAVRERLGYYAKTINFNEAFVSDTETRRTSMQIPGY